MCERVDPAQVLYLPFLAFVPCIVCCSFLKAVEFCLSLNWFLCLLPGGELPAAHSKMHVATQRLQSTISLALHPSPTHLQCCNIKFTILFCSQQKQRLVVSRCITECLLKEMQPVVNIYAKGGTQNELPFFQQQKIIVIRLSVVRSAVLCFLSP